MNLFAQTDGRWFIEARRYAITLDGIPLDTLNWSSMVRAGTEVEMAVVVQQTGHSYPVVCPICLVNNVTPKNSDGHFTW